MKNKGIRIRLDDIEKRELELKAKEFGFNGLSEYLRFVGKHCKEITTKVEK